MREAIMELVTIIFNWQRLTAVVKLRLGSFMTMIEHLRLSILARWQTGYYWVIDIPRHLLLPETSMLPCNPCIKEVFLGNISLINLPGTPLEHLMR